MKNYQTLKKLKQKDKTKHLELLHACFTLLIVLINHFK